MYMRAGDMTKSEFLNCSFGHRGNYLTLIRVNEVIKINTSTGMLLGQFAQEWAHE